MFGQNINPTQTVAGSMPNPAAPVPAPHPADAVHSALADIASTLPSMDVTPTHTPLPQPTSAPVVAQPHNTPGLDQIPAPSFVTTQPATSTPSQHHDPTQQHMPASEDLLSIKHEALTALSPLIDHLDQKPEERFRTTMMLIQAADDQTLIKAAYDAAKAIEDEKVRAQALLDVVNEINYFTAPHHDEEQ